MMHTVASSRPKKGMMQEPGLPFLFPFLPRGHNPCMMYPVPPYLKGPPAPPTPPDAPSASLVPCTRYKSHTWRWRRNEDSPGLLFLLFLLVPSHQHRPPRPFAQSAMVQCLLNPLAEHEVAQDLLRAVLHRPWRPQSPLSTCCNVVTTPERNMRLCRSASEHHSADPD